jgi:S-adenosylmethionine decarboxylase
MSPLQVIFDPCGYSVNGLRGEEYFTIHITPQSPCSYVSFESNVQLDDYTELINKVG